MTADLQEKLDKNAQKSRQLSLGKALDEPFESWPEHRRAAPNALIRCALFRAARGGRSASRHIHQKCAGCPVLLGRGGRARPPQAALQVARLVRRYRHEADQDPPRSRA
jgi:hypothetical protein